MTFHPAEGIERFFLTDTGFGSAIYDNPDGGAYTLKPKGGYHRWGPDKKRFVVPACEIPTIHGRRTRLAQLLVHTAKKRDVPTVTPTAALYRLGKKLPKLGLDRDSVQRITMNPLTFSKNFVWPGLNRYGSAVNKQWHKTFDKLHDLTPVFEDAIPLGLVVAAPFPEDTGRLVYDLGRCLIGAAAYTGMVVAVKIKPLKPFTDRPLWSGTTGTRASVSTRKVSAKGAPSAAPPTTTNPPAATTKRAADGQKAPNPHSRLQLPLR